MEKMYLLCTLQQQFGTLITKRFLLSDLQPYQARFWPELLCLCAMIVLFVPYPISPIWKIPTSSAVHRPKGDVSMAKKTPLATVPPMNSPPAPTTKLHIATPTTLVTPPILSVTRETSICEEATMSPTQKTAPTNSTTRSTPSTVVRVGTGVNANHAMNP